MRGAMLLLPVASNKRGAAPLLLGQCSCYRQQLPLPLRRYYYTIAKAGYGQAGCKACWAAVAGRGGKAARRCAAAAVGYNARWNVINNQQLTINNHNINNNNNIIINNNTNQ